LKDVPIYEYECETCHDRFEVMQKFSDKPRKKCVKCGGPIHKILSAPALVFKGTGWYVTDYASPERKRAQKADAGGNGNGKGSGNSSSGSASSTASSTSSKSGD
jgi:putative FmdB family regulatory protein